MDILPAPTLNARTNGNFRVPRSETPLAFTGERMTGAIEGQIEFEHYHRYYMARDLCDGRDVLDIASGEGYGAALLAGVATSVIGVDVDHASVAHARANYLFANLQFLQGDALAVPLLDACVDVVVSFETIEHVPDQARFIGEVKRVLRPGGIFVVSTPDRAVYSAAGSDPNPYHVLELTDPEFRLLLATSFTRSRVLSQRPVLGSVLAARDSQQWRSYERRGPDIIEATCGLARAHYLLAVATDGELPEIPSSIYLDRRRVHDVMQGFLHLPVAAGEVARLTQQAAEIARERDIAQGEATLAQNHLRAAGAHLQTAELGRTVAEARAAELSLDLEAARSDALRAAQETKTIQDRQHEAEQGRIAAEAAAEQARLTADAVLYSSSWRLLAPLRAVGRRNPRLARTLRRLTKVIWWTATLQIGHRYVMYRRRPAAAMLSVAAAPPPLVETPPAVVEPDLPATVEMPPPTPVTPDPVVDEVPLSTPTAPDPVAPSLREAFVAWHGQVPIHFPPVAAPEVSVIIPIYRGLADLENCLRSLALHRAIEPSFEVILIDDCPTEPLLWAIPYSGGLIRISNPEESPIRKILVSY